MYISNILIFQLIFVILKLFLGHPVYSLPPPEVVVEVLFPDLENLEDLEDLEPDEDDRDPPRLLDSVKVTNNTQRIIKIANDLLCTNISIDCHTVAQCHGQGNDRQTIKLLINPMLDGLKN